MTFQVRDRNAGRAVDLAGDGQPPIARPPAPLPTRPQATPPPQVGPSSADAIGYVRTTRVVYGNEFDRQEEVRVPVFGAHAKVRVGGSVTQNLGDYNSARVEVSIEMPCLPETSEVNRVYMMLSQQVDQLIRRELELATQDPSAPPPTY